ncbi:uncharacterized protein LOC108236758 isoform X2 [Kryptolebias marmoratus]|uniref:uncharacterized protein LOC108236758 isoform X2 n=1 Tax=Kryptolebias marmoratus TaxID=37003 RepID=UPI0007F89AE8|nr:uncharacterized protein LOC108236758 isoform X2 [Kryptolebias marmoratus]
MDGFADLFTDAFSESSVPSFTDGDLDFESLSFDDKREEDSTENSTTTTDEALLQEATDESEALLGKATAGTPLVVEDEESTGDESDEEEFESKDGYTSSEEGSSSSGEDVEENVRAAEEPGDLLMSVCCSDNPYDARNEDVIFAEGQPVASEGADDPEDSNKVQGEAESDEEASYFGGIPERGEETLATVVEGAEAEEDKRGTEESSDSDREDMTVKEEENVLPQEAENPSEVSPTVEDSLEFPPLSMQNLQDLITEVEGDEFAVKMTEFTGDEHQEAGETIADYPSDFSSGEYTGAELNASPLAKQEHGAVTELPWVSRAEDSGCEKDDGFLCSTDLEVDADKIRSLDAAVGEHNGRESERLLAVTGESSSCSSSDGDEPRRGTRDELLDNLSVRNAENNKELEVVELQEFSRWSSSYDNTIKDRFDPADFIRSGFDASKTDTLLSEYPLTTEDTDETEDTSSDENQCPADDANCYSVVQSVTTSPSNQGSIDDSFFFNTDSSEATEEGQLDDDEDEERRNSEQMKERIEAFKRFYDNSDDENGREERQAKVQFCADPLSQVNYYETDSDRDSISSSSDMEEDLSSEEPREPKDTPEVTPDCEPPNPEPPQSVPEVRDTQTCTKTYKGFSGLKLMVTLGVGTMMGLLMFWLITEQPDWFSDFFSV